MELKDLQESLVKHNLKIKTLSAEFAEVTSQREMEALNGRGRASLAEFAAAIARLRTLADKAVDGDLLRADAEGHARQLAECREHFRRANMDCILRLRHSERANLLDDGGLRKRQKEEPESGEAVKESKRMTEGLHALARQLASTVERSSMTVDELAASSRGVNETQDEFRQMGSVIGQSRRLINKYGRRETTDKVLIFFAFAFFFACVFYILRKRVLGPLDPFSIAWNALSALVNYVLAAIR